MNLKGFLCEYPDVLFGDKDDEIFTCLRIMLDGLCSMRLAKLLNYACRFMDDKDLYLEIGTYTGFSLLAAAYQSGKKFIGIDNFSQNFGTTVAVVEKLQHNIDKLPGDYTVIEGDFRLTNLQEILPNESKIGVFLIDGSHTYEDVMDSISWAKGYLADESLVVFDDVKVPGVKKAVEEIRQDPSFTEICFANAFDDDNKNRGRLTNKYIHNGFSLMAYRKAIN